MVASRDSRRERASQRQTLPGRRWVPPSQRSGGRPARASRRPASTARPAAVRCGRGGRPSISGRGGRASALRRRKKARSPSHAASSCSPTCLNRVSTSARRPRSSAASRARPVRAGQLLQQARDGGRHPGELGRNEAEDHLRAGLHEGESQVAGQERGLDLGALEIHLLRQPAGAQAGEDAERQVGRDRPVVQHVAPGQDGGVGRRLGEPCRRDVAVGDDEGLGHPGGPGGGG